MVGVGECLKFKQVVAGVAASLREKRRKENLQVTTIIK
jgi:hypothetical protein